MISISYVVLLAGIKMKSTKAAMVSAFVVILLTQGNIGSYTLVNNIPFYAALMALAAAAVFLCIYKIEEKDV